MYILIFENIANHLIRLTFHVAKMNCINFIDNIFISRNVVDFSNAGMVVEATMQVRLPTVMNKYNEHILLFSMK